MPSHQLEELFQPFVQVEAAVSQADGGTGLGLAITRQLARLLGGDVEVQSSRGEGSVFTVRTPALLPGHDEPASSAAEQRTPVAA